jgi:acyl-CoA thioesterase I
VSFMSEAERRPAASSNNRSYGYERGLRHIAAAAIATLVLWTVAVHAGPAVPVKIVALGDSLTAGLGLPVSQGFAPRLQAALAAKGDAAEIINAGVSGNTASDGLARLDWSVPSGTEAVILELGANDMLRGLTPQVTREALMTILRRLSERHIRVLLCGMRAAPNLGSDYAKSFQGIYPELAAAFGVPLYPFFLDGVAADPKLLQNDGLHPNAAGVDVIVAGILPDVEALIAEVRKARSP